MKKPPDTISKERVLSYDFLGDKLGFPDITKASLQGIEEWIDKHLPDENFAKEDLMVLVRKIREQAGIIDP